MTKAVGWIAVALTALAATGADAGTAPAQLRGGVAQCRRSQLSLVATAYGEAGPQFAQTLTFTNVASTACELAGWPTIRAQDAHRRPLPTRTLRVVQTRPGARPFRTVVVKAQGAASFDVFGAVWDAAANRRCPSIRKLAVRLPGVSPLIVPVALPDCGTLYIAPIIAGRTDRKAWSTLWKK